MPLAFPHTHILDDRHVVELVHIMLIVRLQVWRIRHAVEFFDKFLVGFWIARCFRLRIDLSPSR
jgi:hypothetical protein